MPKFEHEVHDAVARTTVRYWSRRGVNRDTQEIYQDAYEVSLRASETYDPSLNTTPITYLSSCAIRRCQDRLTRRANIASTRSNGYLKELGLTTTRVRMPTSSGATPFVTNVTWECETHEQLVSFRMNELAETLENGELLLKLALKEIKVSEVAEESAAAHRLYRGVKRLKRLFAEDPVLAALATGNHVEDKSTHH